MNANEWDETLRRLALTRTAVPPANLTTNVWREIRRRRGRQVRRENFFDALVGAGLRPRWALSAVSLAIAVSVVFGVIEASATMETPSPLGLNVFSAAAPTLPSTLISQIR